MKNIADAKENNAAQLEIEKADQSNIETNDMEKKLADITKKSVTKKLTNKIKSTKTDKIVNIASENEMKEAKIKKTTSKKVASKKNTDKVVNLESKAEKLSTNESEVLEAKVKEISTTKPINKKNDDNPKALEAKTKKTATKIEEKVAKVKKTATKKVSVKKTAETKGLDDKVKVLEVVEIKTKKITTKKLDEIKDLNDNDKKENTKKLAVKKTAAKTLVNIKEKEVVETKAKKEGIEKFVEKNIIDDKKKLDAKIDVNLIETVVLDAKAKKTDVEKAAVVKTKTKKSTVKTKADVKEKVILETEVKKESTEKSLVKKPTEKTSKENFKIKEVLSKASEPLKKIVKAASTETFLTDIKFLDFNLPKELLQALQDNNFIYCTNIQAKSIPISLKGKDVNGQAETGTGKTVAFLIPIIAKLLTKKPLENKLPRALIVLPTRELALQVFNECKLLTKNTKLKQCLIIGGIDYKKQAELLQSHPEIIVATPGRIIDYAKQNIFKANGIEIVVLDEADRLLDMGFIEDLKFLLNKLPSFKIRQTLLFSATLDDRVEELIYQYSNPPVVVDAISDCSKTADIIQEIYHVGLEDKFQLLLGLLATEKIEKAIIFANTRAIVNKLVKRLCSSGFPTAGITGDLPQKKRNKLMEMFKDDKLKILIATDVASRGIHVDKISHVINYDLPHEPENYVHRIGRTARAGQTGKAISFGCENGIFNLPGIEKYLNAKIPVVWASESFFKKDSVSEKNILSKPSEIKKKVISVPEKKYNNSNKYHFNGPSTSSRPGGIFGLSVLNPSNSETEYTEDYKLKWDFNNIFKLDEINSETENKKKKKYNFKKRKQQKNNDIN